MKINRPIGKEKSNLEESSEIIKQAVYSECLVKLKLDGDIKNLSKKKEGIVEKIFNSIKPFFTKDKDSEVIVLQDALGENPILVSLQASKGSESLNEGWEDILRDVLKNEFDTYVEEIKYYSLRPGALETLILKKKLDDATYKKLITKRPGTSSRIIKRIK